MTSDATAKRTCHSGRSAELGASEAELPPPFGIFSSSPRAADGGMEGRKEGIVLTVCDDALFACPPLCASHTHVCAVTDRAGWSASGHLHPRPSPSLLHVPSSRGPVASHLLSYPRARWFQDEAAAVASIPLCAIKKIYVYIKLKKEKKAIALITRCR